MPYSDPAKRNESTQKRAARRQGAKALLPKLRAAAALLQAPRAPLELVAISREQHSDRIASQERRQLVDALREAEDRIQLFHELGKAPLAPIARRELGFGVREATAEVLVSDLHIETLVKPSSTPTGNAFCLSIANLRLQRLFDGVEWHVQHAQQKFSVRDIVVWIGGDTFTNALHPENVETAQLGPTKALMWVQARLIRGLQQLLNSKCNFECIDVICSSGNHGRTTKQMQTSTAADHCWEWVMYQAIATHFKSEPRIRVHAPGDSLHQYHQIYDYHVHYHHGHEVRYQGGVGGISIPMNKASSAWDLVSRCDFHRYGHWHQLLAFGRTTVNGSLIGYDSYAMSVKATPEPPQQAFTLYDSVKGIAMSAPIWVGDPVAEKKLWLNSPYAKEAV